ncbi:heme/hemin ABC transporter substrate-binding protein [Billgrantia montanilacus]|uniref:Hemin ABC transporter substrate-binding protein n=1 Tax=Billgrantia montanilacus TaxID=2282305 RepID=A0A368TPC4_9GAMM|nr:ABC transporter substrate-binding protein [Halomonas montanilacus]RCV86398.1 hemin ABC transporter substrate-binding protein [Halomonas montanilacus]
MTAHPVLGLLFWLALIVSSQAKASDERLVVLGGDIAETVVALGAGAKLIARDDTSLYPDSLAVLPSVGYLRRLSAESVLSVRPSRVLASRYAGPKEVLRQLDAVGVTVVRIEAPTGLGAIPDKVSEVAAALGLEPEGRALADGIQQELDRLDALPPLPDIGAMFILNHTGTTPLVSGDGTAAAAAMEAVGLRNAFDGMTGYRPVSGEALVRHGPDLVLISRHGLDALGGEGALWQLPGLDMTPAGRDRRLIVIDDQGMLGFGPRTPRLLLELRRTLERMPLSVSWYQPPGRRVAWR